MDLVHVVVEGSGQSLEWHEVRFLLSIPDSPLAESQRLRVAFIFVCDNPLLNPRFSSVNRSLCGLVLYYIHLIAIESPSSPSAVSHGQETFVIATVRGPPLRAALRETKLPSKMSTKLAPTAQGATLPLHVRRIIGTDKSDSTDKNLGHQSDRTRKGEPQG